MACRCFLSFLFVTLGVYLMAQDTDQGASSIMDTLNKFDPTYGFKLGGVTVFQPLKFDNNAELREYLILRNRTLKVYPYAKLAGERLEILNDRLELIEKKSARRKYMKRVEKFIYDEFEKELKNLSRSQGRILIKLVNRQTGETAFELVKELRNGFKAFIYQTTASLFNLTLKKEFDPMNVREDYLIEYILQRADADGIIELNPTLLEYNLEALYAKWNETIVPSKQI